MSSLLLRKGMISQYRIMIGCGIDDAWWTYLTLQIKRLHQKTILLQAFNISVTPIDLKVTHSSVNKL